MPLSETALDLSCAILKPFGSLEYLQHEPEFIWSQVPVCEKTMRAENVINFLKKIRWNPKIGGIFEGQEEGFRSF
jgi:hypothetical protein